jgi:hypothetical protein
VAGWGLARFGWGGLYRDEGGNTSTQLQRWLPGNAVMFCAWQPAQNQRGAPTSRQVLHNTHCAAHLYACSKAGSCCGTTCTHNPPLLSSCWTGCVSGLGQLLTQLWTACVHRSMRTLRILKSFRVLRVVKMFK